MVKLKTSEWERRSELMFGHLCDQWDRNLRDSDITKVTLVPNRNLYAVNLDDVGYKARIVLLPDSISKKQLRELDLFFTRLDTQKYGRKKPTGLLWYADASRTTRSPSWESQEGQLAEYNGHEVPHELMFNPQNNLEQTLVLTDAQMKTLPNSNRPKMSIFVADNAPHDPHQIYTLTFGSLRAYYPPGTPAATYNQGYAHLKKRPVLAMQSERAQIRPQGRHLTSDRSVKLARNELRQFFRYHD